MIELSKDMVTAALDNAGIEPDERGIREAYEGRGMWGATCPAVTLPAGKLPVFLVALTLLLAEDGRGEDAMEIAEATETDTMGVGTVAYWRNVKLAG